MEEALLAALLADAGVAAVFGDRIAWGVQPEGAAYPHLTLTKITGGFDHTMDGLGETATPRIQADSDAGSYGQAKTGARAVIAALVGIPAFDPRFQSVDLIDERDDPAELGDGPLHDGSELVFRTSLDLSPCFTANP